MIVAKSSGMPCDFVRLLGGAGMSFALAILVGCTEERPPSMVPDSASARRAIETAMHSWKEGRESGSLVGSLPRVQIVDTSRRPGQVLRSFDILGESAETRYRVFVVKMTFVNPDDVRTERFLVLGNDPVVVFLEEDYQLISHWDHRMTEPTDGGSQ